MKERHHKYKNTNKFIKDYDAPQAFTKQTHQLMHHIVEKGVLYQVTFSIARNPVVFAKKIYSSSQNNGKLTANRSSEALLLGKFVHLSKKQLISTLLTIFI